MHALDCCGVEGFRVKASTASGSPASCRGLAAAYAPIISGVVQKNVGFQAGLFGHLWLLQCLGRSQKAKGETAVLPNDAKSESWSV